MEVILLKSSSLEIESPSVIPVAASVLPENSLSIAPMSSIDPMGLGLYLPFRSTLGALYDLPVIVVKDRCAEQVKVSLSVVDTTCNTWPKPAPATLTALNVFKTSVQHNVAAGTSVTIQSDAGCGNIAFTRLDRINVGTGATLHIGAGTTFLMNVLKVFS